MCARTILRKRGPKDSLKNEDLRDASHFTGLSLKINMPKYKINVNEFQLFLKQCPSNNLDVQRLQFCHKEIYICEYICVLFVKLSYIVRMWKSLGYILLVFRSSYKCCFKVVLVMTLWNHLAFVKLNVFFIDTVTAS